MTNFCALVKVQLFSLVSSNKGKSKNKKSKGGFAGIALILLVLGGVMAFFGYTYSNIFAMGLAQTGGGEKLVPYMIAVSSLVAFLFSFYAAGSAIFGFKDYDMLMSMPLKPQEIVLSKFCVLFISDLFFALTIAVPSLIVYNASVATITLAQIVVSLVMILFSPLLPLAISIVIGVVVYYISSRFRKKNIVQIILLTIFMIAIFALSFLSGYGSAEDPAQMVGSLGAIEKIYFIFPLVINSFNQPLWLLAYIACNIAPVIIVVACICVFYKKLNSIFTAKRTLRNFKLKEYQSNSVGKTLFNKEIKRLFSCPVYAINCLFGVLMALIASIAYSIFYMAMDVQSDPVLVEVFNVINCFIPALFCFMFLLAPTTCCSISLEGQAFWILKTAPVSYLQVLNSKLAVHALFTTTVAFVSSLCIGVFTGFGVIGTILLVLCGVGISTFGGLFGLLMNLIFPKLKWENENQPVKQGLPTFLTTISAFVFVAVLVVVGIYAQLSLELLLAIYSAFFIAVCVALYSILFKYGEKLYNKLN